MKTEATERLRQLTGESDAIEIVSRFESGQWATTVVTYDHDSALTTPVKGHVSGEGKGCSTDLESSIDSAILTYARS